MKVIEKRIVTMVAIVAAIMIAYLIYKSFQDTESFQDIGTSQEMLKDRIKKFQDLYTKNKKLLHPATAERFDANFKVSSMLLENPRVYLSSYNMGLLIHAFDLINYELSEYAHVKPVCPPCPSTSTSTSLPSTPPLISSPSSSLSGGVSSRVEGDYINELKSIVAQFKSASASLSPDLMSRLKADPYFPTNEYLSSYLSDLNSIPSNIPNPLNGCRKDQVLWVGKYERVKFIPIVIGLYRIRVIKENPLLPTKNEYNATDYKKYKTDVLKWQKSFMDFVEAYMKLVPEKQSMLPYYVNLLGFIGATLLTKIESEYNAIRNDTYKQPLDVSSTYSTYLLAEDAMKEIAKV
jgi:hypothetical protein